MRSRLTVIFFSILLSILSILTACKGTDKYKVLFSYKSLLNQEYRFNIGRSIPLTGEKSIEIDGSISTDGNYMYYTSTLDRGNYDIYVRLLTDIRTVRLTSHPSRDSSPAISPDGSTLLFVSNREDPEGDIYVVDIDAGKMFKNKKSVQKSLDNKAVNLSRQADPETGVLQRIKDTHPVWSPKGEKIAYSSVGNGIENIWIMDSNGKNKKQLTYSGGTYPHFSPDGEYLTFISYEKKGSRGDIYTLNITNQKVTAITNTTSIELYPRFTRNNYTVVFTRIAEDTNKDNKLNLDDDSFLVAKNLSTGEESILTHPGSISFAARWFPAFSTDLYSGILVYAHQEKENINLNIIPDSGIIPKRRTARLQYDLAQKYLNEYSDKESYNLALKRVYDFFNKKRDPDSISYITRAIKDRLEYEKRERISHKETNSIFKKYSYKKFYPTLHWNFLSIKKKKSSSLTILKKGLKNSVGKNKAYQPYLLEDIADEYSKTGQIKKALATYKKIITSYRKYKRSLYVHKKIAEIELKRIQDPFQVSALFILSKGRAEDKVKLKKLILKKLEKTGTSKKRLTIINSLAKKHVSDANSSLILTYSRAKELYDLKKYKDSLIQITSILPSIKSSDLLFYRAHILYANLLKLSNDSITAEKYLAKATNRYRLIWNEKDFTRHVLWLVQHYEKQGEKLEQSGNFRKASTLYRKYSRLMSFVHRRRLYENIYNQYGPRSHVLYIDALFKTGPSSAERVRKDYEKNLPKARLDFDKAFIYGLGYIYTKKGLEQEQKKIQTYEDELIGSEGLLDNYKKALRHIEWAIFLDDSFVEPILLKSWLYQYIDILKTRGDRDLKKRIALHYPPRLIESNIDLLERTAAINNEILYPENEGNILLNIANSYYLLSNFPEALDYYQKCLQYKKQFNTPLEEAQFRFHMSYCYWQLGNIDEAREQLGITHNIYKQLYDPNIKGPAQETFYLLFKYAALFERHQGNYKKSAALYKKILSYCQLNSIPIDRSRYLQETAFCLMQLNKYDKALSYLKKAEKLLGKLPLDEESYSINFQFFILGPFPIWDLGLDSTVIGESKIYKPLSVRLKKLLNHTYFTDIYSKTGNYYKAYAHTKKKLALQKKGKASIDIKGTTASLNNLGYFSLKQSKFTAAKNYYNNALKHSTNNDIQDISGAFSSSLNLANLYAFIIDNNIKVDFNILDELKGLNKKITVYREKYEELQYKEKFKELQKRAKSEKRDVTETELNELRISISQEAVDLYYTIDVALGTILYYQAQEELKRYSKNSPKISINTPEQAFISYKKNSTIHGLFSKAYKRFSLALPKSLTLQSKEIAAKLYLNSAQSLIHTGDIQKGYDYLLKALAIVKKYKYNRLLLNCRYELALLLIYSPDSKVANKSLAFNYLTQCITQIKEAPFLYASSFKKVTSIYNEYIKQLLKAGKDEAAFNALNEKNHVYRSLLFYSTNYNFREKRDSDLFNKIHTLTSILKQEAQNLSRKIEKADGVATESIQKIELTYAHNLKKFNKEIKSFQKSNTLAGSIFKPVRGSVAVPEGSILCYFFIDNSAVYLWKITSNTKEYEKRIIKNKSPLAIIGSLLNRVEKDKKRIYIFLHDNLFNYLHKIENAAVSTEIPDVMFVTDPLHITYYESTQQTPVFSTLIYGDDISIDQSTSDKKVEIASNKSAPLLFDAIIDDEKSNAFNETYLFKTKTLTPLLIKSKEDTTFKDVILLSESAKYSGIQKLTLCDAQGIKSVTQHLSTTNKITMSTIQLALQGREFLITLGYNDAQLNKTNKTVYKTNLNKKYNTALRARHLDEADIYLKRWLHLTETEEANSRIIERSLLALYKGKPAEAESILNTINVTQLNKDEKIKAATVKIYLSLYNAHFLKTEILIKNNFELLKNTNEYSALNALLLHIMNKANTNSKSLLKKLTRFNYTILAKERLLLLAHEIIELYEDSKKTKGLPYPHSGSSLLSNRERAKISYLNSRLKKDHSGKTSNSPFPLLLILENDNKNKDQLEIETVSNELESRIDSPDTMWIDRLLIIKKLRDHYLAQNNFKKAYTLNIKLLEEGKNKKLTYFLPSIYNTHALLLSAANENDKALKNLQQALTLTVNKNERENLKLHQVEILLRNKNLNKANNVISELESLDSITNQQRFEISLLKTQSELLRLSKLKRVTSLQGEAFAKLFTQCYGMLDNNPSLYMNLSNSRKMTVLFDEYINFQFRAGAQQNALISSELKKYMELLFMFPALTTQQKGSETKNRKILSSYIKKIDLPRVQKSLQRDSAILYVSRYKNDLLIWIISSEFWRPILLKNAYKSVEPLIERYYQSIASLESVSSLSQKFGSLFKGINRFIKDKKRLFICTDAYTEKIPFEVIGKESLFIEQHSLFFMPSIMNVTAQQKPGARAIYVDKNKSTLSSYLEEVALKETGIKLISNTDTQIQFAHIQSPLYYDKSTKTIKMKKSKAKYIYFSGYRNTTISQNHFSFIMSLMGKEALLINSAAIKDINSALFSETYYSLIKNKNSIQDSFYKAQQQVRIHKNYNHPAYWSGIRLFLTGLRTD